jgi:hypothetical protein
MPDTAQAHTEPLTLQGLHSELLALRQRVEDLEDLHDLHEAIAANAGRTLTPWDQAKQDLDLE